MRQQQTTGHYVPDTGKYSLRNPHTMRSRLMLEVASEFGGVRSWPHKQPLIYMRAQGATEWAVTLFGSDSAEVVPQVGRGEITFAIVNPGAVLGLAIRGVGPYPEPIPVRAITILPQFDQLGFAVHRRTGITSFSDLRDKRYPLKVSVRGQLDHSVLTVIREVIGAVGITFDDIESWGGKVIFDPDLPDQRVKGVPSGDVDAIWDEAMPMYAAAAWDADMRFLRFDEDHLKKLEAMGLRRVKLNREVFPQITDEVWAIDFSGWTVYTIDTTPDEYVTAFCEALEARKDRIPFFTPGPYSLAGDGGLPLDRMCRDTPEGPLYIPLHPAAERFWRQQGYLA
ncbi:MAG: hypothetical protein HW416_1428 [Chloroflexi bacterium]|nr:hypothetical protein [Chloroflexota bacterium]